MMKKALKDRQRLLIEVRVTNPMDEELEKDSDLAPAVKDSDEPGVIKDDYKPGMEMNPGKDYLDDDDMKERDINDEKTEDSFLKGMIGRMPRPAPGDQDSLGARARRGMIEKMNAKKGLKTKG
jgi:hypothetical protein